MQINGYTVPTAYVLGFLTLFAWGLRLEGIAKANDERSRDNVEVAAEAAKQSKDVGDRLIRVEEQTKATAKDVDEIKDVQKEQSKKLDQIIEQLNRR